MAKLPGLEGFDEDTLRSRSSGRRNGGRVVTDSRLRPAPELRPQAAPVDTYARPAQAPIDNTLKDLASALADLNPSLMRFAEVQKTVSDETLPARITQRYAGKTPEEQAAMMENDPDAKSILGQRAIAANAGRALAQRMGEEAAKYYESGFDKDNGDLEGYLNGQMRKAIEANPNNPFFAEQFAEVFGPISNTIRARQTEYLAGRANLKKTEVVQGSWLGTVQKGILEDKPAADIAAEIRGAYETNRKGLNLSYEDQDKAQVSVIQQLMLQMDQEPGQSEKIFGVIKALAVNPRTLGDGTTQGRLLDSATLGPDVAKLLTAAEGKVNEQRELTNFRTIDGFRQQAENGNLDEDALDAFVNDPKTAKLLSPASRAALLAADRSAKEQAAKALFTQQQKQAERDELNQIDVDALSAGDEGALSVLRDREVVTADGGTRVVTVDQQRAAAQRRMLERESRLVATDPRGRDAAQAESFQRQARWFSTNGIKHEQWANTLKAGVAGMSSAQEKAGITDATSSGFQLYRQLSAKTPNYLRTLLTSDEAQVYDTAQVMMEEGGKTEDEALIAAQRFFSDPTRASSVTANLSAKEVTAALEANTSSGIFTNGWDNPEIMSGEVQKLAKVFVVAGGLSPSKAIARAAEKVAKGYTKVNGWAVKTFDREVPADFGDKAERYLIDFADKHGAAAGIEFDDITLQAVPGTRDMWRVVSKSEGLPMVIDGDGMFTSANIRDYAERDRMTAEEALIKRQTERRKWGRSVVGTGGIVPIGGERSEPMSDKDVRIGPLEFDLPAWLNPSEEDIERRLKPPEAADTGASGKPVSNLFGNR